MLKKLLNYYLEPVDWRFDKLTAEEQAIVGSQERLDALRNFPTAELQNLVNYSYSEELESFEETEETEETADNYTGPPEGQHIFISIRRLERFLEICKEVTNGNYGA